MNDTDNGILWPGDTPNPNIAQQKAASGNPLDGLGNFLGDTLGFVSGGLLPDSKGQHHGTLAEAVSLIFGHNPWEAERYPKLVEQTRPKAGWEPQPGQAPAVATKPVGTSPLDDPAARQQARDGMVASDAGSLVDAGRGGDWHTPETLAPSATSIPTKPNRKVAGGPVGAASMADIEASREAAISRSQQTQQGNPDVADAGPQTGIDKSPKIYDWRSNLDAQKPWDSLSAKRKLQVNIHGGNRPVPGDDAGGRNVAYDDKSAPTASHMEVAKQFLDADRYQDRDALAAFIKKSGGLDVNPATTAWCAGFANAVLGASGVRGTGSLTAKSFLEWGKPTDQPSKGDVVVLHRGDPSSWQGHVGFFVGFQGDKVLILGGNQGNRVSVQAFPRDRIAGFRVPPRAGTSVPTPPTQVRASASFSDAYRSVYRTMPVPYYN